MGETHFVMGERWKDHFYRAAAKGEGLDKIKVVDLRGWIDEPEAMGLPSLLQDLVILSFAQQTNRSLTLHAGPFEPELGKLPSEAAFKQQPLPDGAAWDRALEVAQAALGISGLPSFLSGQSVVRFSELVKAETLKLHEPAARLKSALEQRAADFSLGGKSFERLTAAQEAVKLLAVVKNRGDAALVEAIAELELQTPVEAIGTSLKKAAELTAKIKDCDLTALKSVAQLPEKSGEEGQKLRAEVFEAFRRHEYAVPFGPTFDKANHAAVQLLSRLVAPIVKSQEGPEATLNSSREQSRVIGDMIPDWIPDAAANALLVVINLPDRCRMGERMQIVVTPNLHALISSDAEAEVDLGKSRLYLPRYGIEHPLRETV
jgi:hypothetical protein